MKILTLINKLKKHAANKPKKLACVRLDANGDIAQSKSFEEIYTKANIIANYLSNFKLNNKKVALFYGTDIEFLEVFLACIMTNIIPISFYIDKSSTIDKLPENISKLIEHDIISAVITNLKIQAPNFLVINPSSNGQHNTDEVKLNNYIDNDCCYMQLSSGTTSDPKLTSISHKNIKYSLHSTAQAWGYKDSSKTLIWAPHAFTYGLICGYLLPIYTGTTGYYLSPKQFIDNPLLWLQAISDYGVTHTGSPNFGFQYILNNINTDQKLNIKLSKLQVMVNAGERVDLKTIKKFIENFNLYGLSETCICPAYGMTEFTGLITTSNPNETFRYSTLDSKAIEKNQVILSNNSESISYVSCGKPIKHCHIKIIDTQTKKELADNSIGEIQLSGPYITETNNFSNGKLNTGDLGFTLDNELYIVGRLKDLIIVHGKNYYPDDLEFFAKNSHKLLKGNKCVAVSKSYHSEDQIVIIQEISKTYNELIFNEIIQAIYDNILKKFGIKLFDVTLVSKGVIPVTQGQKLKRQKCKQYYNKHQLQYLCSMRTFKNFKKDNYYSAQSYSNGEAISCIRKLVKNTLTDLDSNITNDNNLNELGLSSIKKVAILRELENTFNIKFHLSDMLGPISINSLFENINKQRSKRL